MRPGRELNVKIATEIFNHQVELIKGELYEIHSTGQFPLKDYSGEMQNAWEIVQKMKVTLIPIVGDQWFAFIGSVSNLGWDSPQAVLHFLESGDFASSGAALDESPSLAICMAAVKAADKRKSSLNEADEPQTTIEVVSETESTKYTTH